MAKVNPIPEGYPRVTPYLSVDGAAEAIDFYCKVLGGTERGVMRGPDGKVGHAEVAFGDSVLMLSDPFTDMGGAPSPKALGDSTVTVHMYVEDVDDVFARALEAGATELFAVQDQFYGDRSGTFRDPWGHRWHIASHIEDVSPDEMEKRAAEAMGGG